jgi:hypothetical protein
MVADPDLERGGKTSVVAALTIAAAPPRPRAAIGDCRGSGVIAQGFDRAKAFGPLVVA